MSLPVRVLHIIDSLGAGGSERWLYDMIRLADPSQSVHRVVTVFPDTGHFKYADKLREINAYSESPPAENEPTAKPDQAPRRSWIKKLLRPLFVPDSAPLAFVRKAVDSRISLISRRFLRRFPRVFRECRRFRPDIIYAHTFEGFLFGLCLKQLVGLPLVHQLPSRFSQMRDAGYNWMIPLYRKSHRLVARFPHAAGYEDELLSVGVSPAKLLSIHGVLDLVPCRAAKLQRDTHRSAIRQQLGLPPEALIGLSIGRLHSSKGHLCAARALPSINKQFPCLHWVVLGEGPDRQLLETELRENDSAKNAHLIGFVDDPIPYCAAADIYFRTPIYEGENLSSYLAMSQGLPVVGSQTGCPNDLIDIVGHGWHTRTNDVEDFAQHVCHALNLPDHGASFGRRGQEYCESQLDIRTTVADLEAMYQQFARKS